ncbi:MAG TPA: hypothetical protein VFY16_03930 [Gemmatimonadaceae bacterium]|nr:hypothetical protein [Gemmatimonadaceae bacterium]
MRYHRRFILLLAALALPGCVRLQSAPIDTSARRAPLPADSVLVYATDADAPARHDSVAYVEARADWLLGGGRVVEALRAEAGRLGANGVVLHELVAASALRQVGDVALGGGVAETRARGVAIFTPPSAN